MIIYYANNLYYLIYAHPFILLYFLFVHKKRNMWGSIFSPLIARVSVLHATDTPGGYVEGFGEKSFSFLGGNIFFL